MPQVICLTQSIKLREKSVQNAAQAHVWLRRVHRRTVRLSSRGLPPLSEFIQLFSLHFLELQCSLIYLCFWFCDVISPKTHNKTWKGEKWFWRTLENHQKKS